MVQLLRRRGLHLLLATAMLGLGIGLVFEGMPRGAGLSFGLTLIFLHQFFRRPLPYGSPR